MCEERYVFDIIADRFLLYPLAFVRYFRLQKEEEIERERVSLVIGQSSIGDSACPVGTRSSKHSAAHVKIDPLIDHKGDTARSDHDIPSRDSSAALDYTKPTILELCDRRKELGK